ncbi:hypothetical protein AB0H42_29440 [Nocardia sp. NPDC050799]|uniref:hypothetical protein n=1 Tax=Nocardia sp. NPDC050799 TaxID=3154842 RepID=UPI0033D166E9
MVAGTVPALPAAATRIFQLDGPSFATVLAAVFADTRRARPAGIAAPLRRSDR